MEVILSVISACLAIASIVFSIVVYSKSLVRERKQATLEAYNRLQLEVFDGINKYSPKEISIISDDKKSTEYKILSGYLARIEHFCVGLNEDIYDKNVFYKLAHGYFDGDLLEKRIAPIITSKKNSEKYYSNLVSVLNWMKDCQ